MSWIFGIAGNIRAFSDASIEVIEKKSTFRFNGHQLKILAGGNPNTLIFSDGNPDNTFDFVVAGAGFCRSNNGSNTKDWRTVLEKGDIPGLNGHYAVLKWSSRGINIYTDKTGLRDFYIAQKDDAVIFSTRIDLLIPFVDTEINYDVFGSGWLLFNRISPDSPLKNITRLVAGSSAEIFSDTADVKINEMNWLPQSYRSVFGMDDFKRELFDIVSASFSEEQQVSFSLSGGMDSRVLLSILIKKGFRNWTAHTFGNPGKPDSVIAKRLAEEFGFPHEQLVSGIPDTCECISGIEDYIVQTTVNNSASSAFYLKHYSHIENKDGINIDGGFGEIWRREFFYKLLFKGRDSLVSKDTNRILPYLFYDRGDIFSEEVKLRMMEGSKRQLDEIFLRLPEPSPNNPENWVDLFALKTRLTNYYGPEQSHLDGIIKSVMPFAQISLLNMLPGIPVEQRKSGKMFREIIRQNENKLTAFGLAKNNTIYPFRLNSFQSRVWGLLNTKFKISYSPDNFQHEYLNKVKEYAQDCVESREIKESGIYDYAKISSALKEYYSGNLLFANIVDWFVSFDLFRRRISSKPQI